MLKHTLMFILIPAMLMGCMPKSQVLEGNRFQSSSPWLAVQVETRIPYLGMIESSQFNNGVEEARNLTVSSRFRTYYFVETGRNNKAERFFIIQVRRIVEMNFYYLDRFYHWWKNPLTLGKIELGGRKFKTASLITSFKGSDFAKYLNSKSCFLSDCYAIKVANRICSPREMLILWYGEDCEQFGQRLNGFGMGAEQKRHAMITALDESFTKALIFEE